MSTNKLSKLAAEIQTHTEDTGVFAYGDDEIRYDIIRKAQASDKASRRVKIKVHPDQRVVAIAPFDASSDVIKRAVTKRARWIWKHIQDFSKQNEFILPKQYISGETQFYLGKRYLLKVSISPQQPEQVKLYRGKLLVSVPSEKLRNKSRVKFLLDDWYLRQAKRVLHERLLELAACLEWVTSTPTFKIIAMKKQWGSCSIKGQLNINPHLIKAPRDCIDYVLMHELCHIAEHNHSERFWQLLSQHMPDWKERKAKLDDMAEMYLNE
ncbi:M48 family metallopeptidase [Pleionea litopenaei]|uniref:SprT family zinc-dependent metalloprotease n=1 Tax=Pleionea litopenaei TaxID=3070815 RepID=A0AA51X6C5_9GAMM|nr:SprT family zinc-dependent metalloprotease [Pleionea sp. HL-JVS1]WMS86709.1 SprT family zinc-dependent metalloprotease [Pleionea sp. HL-JVS1]